MATHHRQCSRCRSTTPSPFCYVCEEEPEERDGMREAKDWRDYQDRLAEIETTQIDE